MPEGWGGVQGRTNCGRGPQGREQDLSREGVAAAQRVGKFVDFLDQSRS